MEINVIKNADVITIAPVGNIDYVTSPELEKAVNEQSEVAQQLILDLKDVNYISSAGLRVLLDADEAMEEKGGFKIINVSSAVMEVLVMTGFADALTIEG